MSYTSGLRTVNHELREIAQRHKAQSQQFGLPIPTPEAMIWHTSGLVAYFTDTMLDDFERGLMQHVVGWDLQDCLDAMIDLQTISSEKSTHIERGDAIHLYNARRNDIWVLLAEAGQAEGRDAVFMVREYYQHKPINSDGEWKEAMVNAAAMLKAESVQNRIANWVGAQAVLLGMYLAEGVDDETWNTDLRHDDGAVATGGVGEVSAVDDGGLPESPAAVDASDAPGRDA